MMGLARIFSVVRHSTFPCAAILAFRPIARPRGQLAVTLRAHGRGGPGERLPDAAPLRVEVLPTSENGLYVPSQAMLDRTANIKVGRVNQVIGRLCSSALNSSDHARLSSPPLMHAVDRDNAIRRRTSEQDWGYIFLVSG